MEGARRRGVTRPSKPPLKAVASDTWGPAACSPAARSAPVSLLLAHDQLRSEVLVVFYWGRFWSVCAPRTRVLLSGPGSGRPGAAGGRRTVAGPGVGARSSLARA